MFELALTIGLAVVPQSSPFEHEMLVVSDRLVRGTLPFTALELGDGGIAQDAHGATRFPATPGGVQVQARPEGVKLDFPNAQELLVTPDGRAHVRSGEASEPFSLVLKLYTADGAVLRLRRSGHGRPLRLVELVGGRGPRMLWRDGKPMSNASARRRFYSPSWVALGDGRAVYRIMQLGPVLVAERMVCPDELARELPARQVIVAGDVLRASLRRLPRIVPRHMSEFPHAREIADGLAAVSGRLFAAGVRRRPDGALAPLTVPLVGGMRLELSVRSRGPVVLGLFSQGELVPVVEWTVSETTRLHLVEPEGGRQGRPRYVLQGLVIRDLVDRLLPFRPMPNDVSRARRLLVEMSETTPNPAAGSPRVRRDN